MNSVGRQFRTHLIPSVLDRVEARGGDVAALLRACALPETVRSLPWVELPLSSLHAVFDLAERATSDHSLGLQLAQQLPRSTWDLLQLHALAAPTLREGVARVRKLIVLFNEFVDIRVTESESTTSVEHSIGGHPEGLSRHGNELWVAAMLVRAREATGVRIVPQEVWFGHARPGEVSALEEFFGTTSIRFGAGTSGARLSREDMARPLRTSDPVLLGVLDRLAEPSLSLRQGHRGVAAQALGELERGWSNQIPSIQWLARRMSTSVRALQRSFQEEHTSFRALLDQVRRGRARTLLEANVPLDEIAQRLGYSERSAFVRAWARWSGREKV